MVSRSNAPRKQCCKFFMWLPSPGKTGLGFTRANNGLETLLKTRFNTLVISTRINKNGVCIHTDALSIFVELFHKNWKEHAKTEDKTYSGHPGHRGGKTDEPRPGTILIVRRLRPTKLQHSLRFQKVGILQRWSYWLVSFTAVFRLVTSRNLKTAAKETTYWREHLKYVWNVYCDVTNHRRDHHTKETTGNERFPICHGTNYFHFVSTFSIFTSKQLLFLPICL